MRTAFRIFDLGSIMSEAPNVPDRGEAVPARNHVNYRDWIFCGLAASLEAAGAATS